MTSQVQCLRCQTMRRCGRGGEGAGKPVRGWAFNNVFGRQGGRLYEVELIRGWALIRIHTNLFTPDNSID